MTSANDIDKIIGNKIAEARQRRRLSMKKVADMIDVSHQQLHKYERGINRISASKLFLLSKKMGVDISYFYNVDYDKLSTNCKIIEDLVSDFLKLKSEKKREVILNLLKEMLKK
jgi:transcriptional regulator with XRE-family HTH domain